MKNYLQDSEWQFVSRLATEHVWDAFVIFSLLDNKKRWHEQLRVLHTGEQADRFANAMDKHNKDFILNGQPDAVVHACNKCLCIYEFNGSEGERRVHEFLFHICV